MTPRLSSGDNDPSPRRSFLGRLAAVLAGSASLGGLPQVRPAEAAPQVEDPYVGEIRMFAGDIAPAGWMFCEGQLLQIADNDALFILIGTTYGGDGVTTFALPDLRGRAPMHEGTPFFLGEMGGTETITLAVNQIPSHGHAALAGSAAGTSADPTGRTPAKNAAGVPQYGALADTSLSSATMTTTGGSAPHNNMQPYLAIRFIISLFGIWPSQV